jgi:prolyl 4-hydroxylase
MLADGGQRICTVMVYLNEVEGGGQTHFIRQGVSVTPQRGTALMWWNVRDGQVDESTYHAALPVEAGEKWVATKWIRERPRRA